MFGLIGFFNIQFIIIFNFIVNFKCLQMRIKNNSLIDFFIFSSNNSLLNILIEITNETIVASGTFAEKFILLLISIFIKIKKPPNHLI